MDVKALWTYIVLVNCLTIRGEDENLTSTEMYFGCSFSSDDWCNNENVYNGSNGPQWTRQKAPAEQNPNYYDNYQYDQGGRQFRMTLFGIDAMEWPPKGDYYLYTGPTESNSFAEMHAELQSPVIVVNDARKCLYFSYHNRIPIRLTPTLVVLTTVQERKLIRGRCSSCRILFNGVAKVVRSSSSSSHRRVQLGICW